MVGGVHCNHSLCKQSPDLPIFVGVNCRLETMKEKPFTKRLTNCIVVMVFFVLFSSAGCKCLAATGQKDSLLIEELTDILREQFRLRQLDSAVALVEQIQVIANEADMQVKLADSQANLGLIERAKGNTTAAIDHYRSAAAKYQDADEHASAARVFTQIGQLFVGMQLYGQAYDYFSRSLALRKIENDSLGMANNLVNMAGAYYFAGRLHDAADLYFSALRIADQLNNTPLKAQILMNVSNVFVKQHSYSAAKEYLQQALLLRRLHEDRQGESEVLLNLGIVAYKQGLLDNAEEYYLGSKAIKDEMSTDVPGIIKVTHNLGLLYKEKGENNKAIIYYNNALGMARQVNDMQTQATILNNLGTLMMEEGNDEALPLFLESLQLSQRLQLKNLERINYDNLHQYFASKGNFEQAYDYLLKHKELNDSLFNLESAARIAELQVMYDSEIKEQENLLLREQSHGLRLRFIAVSVSAFAIAVLAAAFIILYNLKQKSLRQSKALLDSRTELSRLEQEKSQQEQLHLKELLFAEEEINQLQKKQIQEQNRELATSALLIINKNEILNSVREHAKKALNSEECEGRICLEQLIREIDNNIDLDAQWELFKRHFEAVHAGFFERLNQQFSNLSHNELKLCAYLRMNFSSKEIAQMLNIEVESANTKRYRLRKKLNLPSDANLVDFLMKF